MAFIMICGLFCNRKILPVPTLTIFTGHTFREPGEPKVKSRRWEGWGRRRFMGFFESENFLDIIFRFC